MINWSEVARKAFIEQLKDIIELERMKKIRELSEIDIDDHRDFNPEYRKELLKITKEPHTKPMTLNELNKLLGGIMPFEFTLSKKNKKLTIALQKKLIK